MAPAAIPAHPNIIGQRMIQFSVKRQSKCTFQSKPALSIEFHKKTIHVLGEYLGSIYGSDIIIGLKGLRRILNDMNDDQGLISLMRCSVGKFSILIEDNDNVKVITSPGGSGLFYTRLNDEVYFTNKEKEIYKYGNNDRINDYEVLHLLVSSGALRSPYGTIFENIQAMPGGHIVEIGCDLNIQRKCYLKRNDSEFGNHTGGYTYEKKYSEFVRLLESTCSIIENATDGSKKVVNLSGGVDSAAILRSFVKAGSDVCALTGGKNETVINVSKAICDLAGVENVMIGMDGYPPRSDDEVEFAKYFYSNNISRTPMAFFYKYNTALAEVGYGGADVIHGQNMDSAYVIDGFRPCFGSTGLGYYHRILRTIPKRLRFTKTWMMPLLNDVGSNILSKITKRSQKYSFTPYDYLLSMIAPSYEHVVPLINDPYMPDECSELERGYVRFKEETVLHPIIGTKSEFASDIKNGLSVQYFNHLVRLVKYVRFIQGAIRAKSAEYRSLGLNIHMPSSEGPLLNYFMQYQLNIMDALSPKRMLYRYFKSEYGKNIVSIIKSSNPSLGKRVMRKVRNKYYSGCGNDCNANDCEMFIQLLLSVISPEKSILINSVKSDVLRNYLISLYGYIDGRVFDSRDARYKAAERFASIEMSLQSP